MLLISISNAKVFSFIHYVSFTGRLCTFTFVSFVLMHIGFL